MIGKAVCIRQAALINARRRSLNEWKEHINNLKDAQVMKSCFDRIRKRRKRIAVRRPEACQPEMRIFLQAPVFLLFLRMCCCFDDSNIQQGF